MLNSKAVTNVGKHLLCAGSVLQVKITFPVLDADALLDGEEDVLVPDDVPYTDSEAVIWLCSICGENAVTAVDAPCPIPKLTPIPEAESL